MSYHLRRVHINRYGGLADKELGPFEKGLNVVFGANEAGKTTIASFVGGVLFGWEEAHGVRNTYRPPEGGRSGFLEFTDAEGSAFKTLARQQGDDGILGDAALVSDIDNNTFKMMFSLTSDELRSLRNTSDVTARLLTAGSGTGSSPASSFVELEQRIVEHTARSQDAACSLPRLSDRLEELQVEMKSAAEAVELSKQEGLELRELEDGLVQASDRAEGLERQISALASCRSGLERVDARMRDCKREISLLEAEQSQEAADKDVSSHVSARLIALDPAEERALRDRLDDYAEEQGKAARSIDAAKNESAASSASYEALMELDNSEGARGPSKASRITQTVVPALLALVFVGAGIPTVLHGRSINSLSLTALGIGLVVFAVIVAITAVVVLMRPDKSAEDHERRKRDGQWVMLQDKKKLDLSLSAKAELDEEIQAFLTANGLNEAEGSIRRARSLLDDAREERSRLSILQQKSASLELRLAAAREELAALEEERRELERKGGFPEGVSLEEVYEQIRSLSAQRDSVFAAREEMSRRIGELGARLANARRDRTFDQAKLEYEQTRTMFRNCRHELVVLLLAKRILEESIAAWESRSQPEVYREASRLFSIITDGAWQQITVTSEGRLFATARDGRELEVRHLSLGTCQQLYLSLRVAMLLHASSIGKAIPVLADDILVNFDAARRVGAARVLAELSEARQVVVFTCHEETVRALRQADPHLTYLEL